MKSTKGLFAAAGLCIALLTGCSSESAAESSAAMQYIKTSVLYDTLSAMYQQPEAYLGKTYHMVGELYAATDQATGDLFYSVYAKEGDEGIGLELDWTNDAVLSAGLADGIAVGDQITVEGVLEATKTTAADGQTVSYLILRVSSLEKRD